MNRALVGLTVTLLGCSGTPTPFDGGAAGGAGGGTGGGTGSAGGVVDDGGIASSGTRLKVRWRVTDGGAREFLSFFDEERGMACQPTPMDGQLRCGPLGALSFVPDPNLFTDATCTSRGSAVFDGFCEPNEGTYLVEYSSASTCTGQLSSLSVAAPVTYSTLYERNDAGTCVSKGLTMPVRAYTPTMPMAFSALAPLTEVEVDRGPITATFAVHASGARALQRVRFTSGGPAVEPQLHADGGGVFMPGYRTYADTTVQDFAEASCTTPLAYEYAAQCLEASEPIVGIFNVGTCGVDITLRQRGALVSADGGVWTRNSGGVCQPGDQTKRLYALGAPIGFETLPQARPVRSGHGRLRFTVAGDSMARLSGRVGTWRDEALSVTCLPLTASDGVTRCLPSSGGAFENFVPERYADVACSRPLFSEQLMACSVPRPIYVWTQPTNPRTGNIDHCAPRTVYRTQGMHAGATWQRVGGSCVAGGPATGTLLELSEVPAASLEALSIVTE